MLLWRIIGMLKHELLVEMFNEYAGMRLFHSF